MLNLHARLLDAPGRAGITLTESFAMLPRTGWVGSMRGEVSQLIKAQPVARAIASKWAKQLHTRGDG